MKNDNFLHDLCNLWPYFNMSINASFDAKAIIQTIDCFLTDSSAGFTMVFNEEVPDYIEWLQKEGIDYEYEYKNGNWDCTVLLSKDCMSYIIAKGIQFNPEILFVDGICDIEGWRKSRNTSAYERVKRKYIYFFLYFDLYESRIDVIAKKEAYSKNKIQRDIDAILKESSHI